MTPCDNLVTIEWAYTTPELVEFFLLFCINGVFLSCILVFCLDLTLSLRGSSL